MHDTDKILQKLTELSSDLKSLQGNVIQLQDGQTLLQADVKGLQNGQHSLQGAVKGVQEAQKSFQETEELRGKLLTGIADIASTILQEQHAQRTDIRSLHDQAHSLRDELHASKEELKSEILAARAEAKRENMDLKATVVRKLKSHEQRIDALEDDAGIPHPDEN
jgi:chromosome segregation ATPase